MYGPHFGVVSEAREKYKNDTCCVLLVDAAIKLAFLDMEPTRKEKSLDFMFLGRFWQTLWQICSEIHDF